MAISTNQKPTIYRNLYENTGPELYEQFYIFPPNQPFVAVRGRRYVLADCYMNGYRSLFRRSIFPKVHCSEGSLLRSFIVSKKKFIVLKVYWSEGSLIRNRGSLLRRFIVPKIHCSEIEVHCSEGSLFRPHIMHMDCHTLRNHSRIITYPYRMGLTLRIHLPYLIYDFTYQAYTIYAQRYALYRIQVAVCISRRVVYITVHFVRIPVPDAI